MQLPDTIRDARGAPVSPSAGPAASQQSRSGSVENRALTRLLPRRLPPPAFLVVAILATAALWIVSRGKWSYAITDSGREWIVPECLARGELLYRDIVYWFGPLTPYLHSLLFRVFGSSFQTLVLAGVLASIVVLAALFIALRRVTGRAEAVLGTVLAIPLLIFMPTSGGAILGMGYRIWHAAAFTLLAVSIAVLPFRWARAAGAGCLCALAFLCRTEWGLAAMGGAAVAAAVRDRFRLSFLRDILVSGLAFLILGGGTLAVFVGLAGANAVLRDGHVLLTGLPPETRRFLLNVSGFQDPVGGSLRLLFSAAIWAGFFLLVDVVAAWKEDRDRLRRRLPWIAGIAVTLLAYHDYAGSVRMAFMSASPLIGLAAFLFGLRRLGRPRSAALCAFGALAVVLSYRKFFSIEDFPYVAPPLLFAVVSGLGILHELVASESLRASRLRHRRWLVLILGALILLSFADRIVSYGKDDGVIVPGTGKMLSADAETARMLGLLSKAIRERTLEHDGLVVFPEGEVLNAISGRRNPLRHKLYLPGYLTSDNETEILSELRRTPPAAIVIVDRSTAMYGRAFFGVNYAKDVMAWINQNFTLFPFDPRRDKSGARLFLRKFASGFQSRRDSAGRP